jgi:putative transposase
LVPLHHYDNLGTARFVTFSCYNRRSLFTEDERFKIFLDELEEARLKYKFSLLGYVIMPSHIHLVIYPNNVIHLGRVIGEVKSFSASRIGLLLKSQGKYNLVMNEKRRNGERRFVFWHRRCYDHNCRTPETVIEKINYCHMNPVRAGLVDHPSKWSWSSYRWYMGYEDAVIDVDGIELLM